MENDGIIQQIEPLWKTLHMVSVDTSLWERKHPVSLQQPPLYEKGITPCQWSVNRVGFWNIPLLEENFYLSTSYFPLIHLYSVIGVGEPCRSSDQFFIEGKFYLLISHFLLTHLYLSISYFLLIHLFLWEWIYSMSVVSGRLVLFGNPFTRVGF